VLGFCKLGKRLLDLVMQPAVVLVVVAYAAVLWIRLEPHIGDKRRTFFVLFEASALFSAAFIATVNYIRIEDRVEAIFGRSALKTLAFPYYKTVNIGCFLLATWFIFEPPIHVALLGAVYLFFSISNLHHSRWICRCETVKDKHHERLMMMIEAHAWLRTENLPSLIGLTLLAWALVILMRFVSRDIVAIDALESFAAGAALLHLFLSVIGFGVHLGAGQDEKEIYEAIEPNQVTALLGRRKSHSDVGWWVCLAIFALALFGSVVKAPYVPDPSASILGSQTIKETGLSILPKPVERK
jgi:hypothetical protein